MGNKNRNTKELVQAKLQVIQSGDFHEKQADMIAEQVVQLKGRDSLNIEDRIDQIQAKGSGGLSISPEVESRIENLKGKGRPLDRHVSEFLGDRFNVDFSKVRIHTDNESNMLARAINARAFTHGTDVVFANGQYQPGSLDGKKLIAHELTHVVQQGRAYEKGVNKKEAIVQRAEWFINKNQLGVRSTNIGDLPIDIPMIGPAVQGVHNLVGWNSYTDYLPMTSSSEYGANELRQQMESDTSEAIFLILGIALSAYQTGTTAGTSTFENIVSVINAMYSPGNPFLEKDILIAVNTALTDYGYIGPAVKALSDLTSFAVQSILKQEYNKVYSKTRNYIFKDLMKVTRLIDFNWYPNINENYSYALFSMYHKTYLGLDIQIFKLAKESGIPLFINNIWNGNKEAEVLVTQQMMRNYMFIGEMANTYNITDPKALKMLFWGYPGHKEDSGHGIMQYVWYEGFAEFNKGPYDFFKKHSDEKFVNDILDIKLQMNELNRFLQLDKIMTQSDPKKKEQILSALFYDYTKVEILNYYHNYKNNKLRDVEYKIVTKLTEYQNIIRFSQIGIDISKKILK